MTRPPFSLYIHIPYCVSKCPYCDFNSHVVAEIPEAGYIDALLRELEHYGAMEDWRERTVQSIFFGGGTPSTFKPQSIGKLLAWVAATFPINLDCEITLEANPGTVDSEKFFGYRDAGVNRISVGVQSFQPKLLQFLGRIHSADEARSALAIVREAGFENFSLDLIYANPGQTLARPGSRPRRGVGISAAAPLRLQPDFRRRHAVSPRISRRPNEVARRRRRNRHGRDDPGKIIGRGPLALRNLELRPSRLALTPQRQLLAQRRLSRSRGRRAQLPSRWLQTSRRGRRWSNEKNPGRYMAQTLEARPAVVETEAIEFAKAAGEFMFLGLRMTEGIAVAKIRREVRQAAGGLLSQDSRLGGREPLGRNRRPSAPDAQGSAGRQCDLRRIPVAPLVKLPKLR